jgi:hypothetical protein
MSERGQRIMIWWGMIFLVIFALAYGLLIGFLPLPPATWTPDEIAGYYSAHSQRILIGAAICSWTGAFAVPLATVFAIQLARLEKGVPVWSILSFAGGILMSMFLVFPPILWGIAAYTPSRPHEITAVIHEMANLTLATTDQFFIFQMIPITYISLTQKIDTNSPFPRWLGYFNLWVAFMFEMGVFGFVTKTGPFAWNGLFVYWFPLILFGTWLSTMSFMMLKALKRQSSNAG